MKLRHDMVTVFVVRPDAHGRGHEFLQLHRAPDDYLGNTWQIVRGTAEPGETAVAAAVRELREETGLVPAELYRAASIETFYIPIDDTLWHSVPFCAVVGRDQEVRLNAEHDACRWIHRGDFDSHCMWASERQVLRDLCRDILDNGPAKPHLKIDT